MVTIDQLYTGQSTAEDEFGLALNRMAFQGGEKDQKFLQKAGEVLSLKSKPHHIIEFYTRLYKVNYFSGFDVALTDKGNSDTNIKTYHELFGIERKRLLNAVFQFLDEHYAHPVVRINHSENLLDIGEKLIFVERQDIHFDYFFAYRISQLNVQILLHFLNYHFASTFNHDYIAISDFLVGVCAEYKNDLLYQKHIDMITRWMEKTRPERKTKVKTKAPRQKTQSPKTKINPEIRMQEIIQFRDDHFIDPDNFEILKQVLEELKMIEKGEPLLIKIDGFKKPYYRALAEEMYERNIWQYRQSPGVVILRELLNDTSTSPLKESETLKVLRTPIKNLLNKIIRDFKDEKKAQQFDD
jgi:hypothetical protein